MRKLQGTQLRLPLSRTVRCPDCGADKCEFELVAN